VIRRCLLGLGALLLFANSGTCGVYQRTKDGRTLVWNNSPRRGDSVTWSGARDTNGYAIGSGTLTWYKSDRTIVTGSNIPAPTTGSAPRGRYTGKMVKGRLQGLVVNIDASGQTFHGTFVNGAKTSDWIPGPPPPASQEHGPSISKSAYNKEPPPPAAGPAHVAVTTLAQPRPSSTPSMLQSNPGEIEPAVKNRMITDFKEQTQSVLSRVNEATGNFKDVDQLNSVPRLPTPVSEEVASLVDRARDFRARLGYETALSECRAETETVDALSTLEQSTQNIAGNNAAAANSGLSDFLKNNPAPPQDSERSLWRYLTSIRLLCGRLEKEAEVRSQRAQAFASDGRTGDAIREYQEAYRIFPNPATAEKIRKLQSNNLGL
jgi:hypothetical protein